MADVKITALTQLGTVQNADALYVVEDSSNTSKYITASQLSDLFVVLARQVSAGTGLTGGGDLSADRTISVADGGIDTLQLAADSVTEDELAATAIGGGQVYFGHGTAAGAGTRLPSGWSVNRAATGQYVVTHNLGSSAYVLQANTVSPAFVAQLINIGSNSFEIRTFDTDALATDGAWHFVMLKY